MHAQESCYGFRFGDLFTSTGRQLIWISENARAVRNCRGRIIFYEGTVEDVTENLKAERALRGALTPS